MSSYSIRNFAASVGKYLRYIGFGTFSVKHEKVYVTMCDFACLSFNISLGFVVFYLSLTYGIERLSSYSLLLALGVLITMMCGSLTSIISMILVFYHRETIWKVITTLDHIIDKFKRIHIYPDFKRYIMFFVFFAVLSVFLIILGLFIMALFLGYDKKIGVLVIYGYLSSSFAASMGWSSMFHLAIYLRLNMINRAIRERFLNDSEKNAIEMTTADGESIVLTLKSIHHDLMRCVYMLNVIFGFQTMLCIGITFLFTLFTLFASFKAFFYHDIDISIALSSLFWCFFYNYFFLCVIMTCNLVDDEDGTLAVNIYKLTNRSVCKPLILQSFGNQVQQISGKSTCGLFNFDYQLIMMIISATSTYFIILIQFESSFQSSKSGKH